MKRVLPVFLALLLFVGSIYFIYFHTQGFSLEKIHQHQLKETSLEFTAPDFSRSILEQPFYYLGKGRQAYVFASQDGLYVIKFLRERKYRPSLWMRASLFFRQLSSPQKKVWEDLERRLSRALESYQIAATELSSQTELLRIHIGPLRVGQKVVLFDGLSRKFIVDLDQTSFLLQKRALPLTKALLQAQDKEKKLLVHQFFQTLKSRCEKKIVVRDAQCTLQNTGVIGEKVIEIDVGSFYKEDHSSSEKEIARSAIALRRFLEQKLPEQLAYFDAELARSIGK